MADQNECERLLGRRLSDAWQCKTVVRNQLAKRLVLSTKQLSALENADASQFHTYGIYLRALRHALAEADLLEQSDVKDCLQTLDECYLATPHMTQILRIRSTMSQKLGEAPPEVDPGYFHSSRARVVFVVLVVIATCFLVLTLGIDYWT